MDIEDYTFAVLVRDSHPIICNFLISLIFEVKWVFLSPMELRVVDKFVLVFPIFECQFVSIFVLDKFTLELPLDLFETTPGLPIPAEITFDSCLSVNWLGLRRCA